MTTQTGSTGARPAPTRSAVVPLTMARKAGMAWKGRHGWLGGLDCGARGYRSAHLQVDLIIVVRFVLAHLKVGTTTLRTIARTLADARSPHGLGLLALTPL